MALLGRAAIAMWWDIVPEHRAEFEHWHSHEHFPERLGIPGFLRGSRWGDADGGEGFFVCYELDDYATLSSPDYLARLNRPTPWSTKLMPHHRNMVRSLCRVLETFGGGIARHALTVRLAPAPGSAARLRAHLRELARRIAAEPGTTGAHLLQTDTPALGVTQEQTIRGGVDPSADWVFVAAGHDRAALERLRAGLLATAQLQREGAQANVVVGLYTLSHAWSMHDRP